MTISLEDTLSRSAEAQESHAGKEGYGGFFSEDLQPASWTGSATRSS
jgi:hypothetical protein